MDSKTNTVNDVVTDAILIVLFVVLVRAAWYIVTWILTKLFLFLSFSIKNLISLFQKQDYDYDD